MKSLKTATDIAKTALSAFQLWHSSLTRKERHCLLMAVVFLILCYGIYMVLMGWHGASIRKEAMISIESPVYATDSFPDTPGIYVEGVDDE